MVGKKSNAKKLLRVLREVRMVVNEIGVFFWRTPTAQQPLVVSEVEQDGWLDAYCGWFPRASMLGAIRLPTSDETELSPSL